MILSKAIRIAAPLTGVATALLLAGPASAAPSNPFGCRASVQGLQIAPLPAVEPTVANPAETPCATDSAGSSGSGSGSGGSGSSGSGSGGSGSGGSGSGSGDSLTACPTGSVLVASAQMCEIISADGSQNIVVSKPFAGPTGGTVVPLAAARRKFKSPCLSGKGPKFAVMGTNKANTIRAAKTAERIIAMGGNDKVIVKRDASCVDGGAGRDTISGGIGKVRLFGGAGNDRLRAAGRVEYVNGGAGKDVAYVTAKEMKYAHRHGCEKVHRIRVKR